MADDKKSNPAETEAKKWLRRIDGAQADFKAWREKCDKVVRIYTDSDASVSDDDADNTRHFNILWANTEVLKPATYARLPVPVVSRRFKDDDPTARQVSEVIERCLIAQFEMGDLDDVMRDVRDDYLLCARGTAWARYDVEFDRDFSDYEEELKENPDAAPPQILGENLCFDHVHWSDFIHPMRRKWRDLPWVSRRVHMDDEAIEKRFGEEKAKLIEGAKRTAEVDTETMGTNNPNNAQSADDERKARGTTPIFEVWSKEDQMVYWVTAGVDELLDKKPPLIRFKGFFPCPRPAYGTCSTNNLMPVTDYRFYQDQAEELDVVTEKISVLSNALKLKGFYPAGKEGDLSDAIETAVNSKDDEILVPMAGWAGFIEGGGSAELVQWLPLDIVLKALQGAFEVRRQIMQDIYEIVGISDIMRGITDPDETLGAQQIKSQSGGLRMRDRQHEIQRFVRDLTRLGAEIVAERFQPQSLQAMTGLPVTPDMVQLMRNDRMRSYRVEIETDSTIEADEAREKATRNEFLGVVAAFMDKAMPIAERQPLLVPVLGELLKFNVRAYRVGREFEDVIEQTVDQLKQVSQQAMQRQQMQSQQEPPEVQVEKAKLQIKAQGDAQAMQMKAQTEQAKLAQDAQMKVQQAELDERLAWRKLMHEQQVDAERLRMEQEQLNARIVIDRTTAQAKIDNQCKEIAAKLGSLYANKNGDGNDAAGAVDQMMQEFASMMNEMAAQMAASAQLQADASMEVAQAYREPRVLLRDESGRVQGSAPGA